MKNLIHLLQTSNEAALQGERRTRQQALPLHLLASLALPVVLMGYCSPRSLSPFFTLTPGAGDLGEVIITSA